MAFFGLTALGSQNIFQNSSNLHQNFHIFTQEDYIDAWNATIGKNKLICRLNQLKNILEKLFHGPIPKNDVIFLNNNFHLLVLEEDSDHSNSSSSNLMTFEESINCTNYLLTYKNYLDFFLKLQNMAENNERNHVVRSNETTNHGFQSFEELQKSLRRNETDKFNKKEMQSKPLTLMQEVIISFYFSLSILLFQYICYIYLIKFY